jgi:hypothetical protein
VPPPSPRKALEVVSENEQRLQTAFQGGSIEAGLELVELLLTDGQRAHDCVQICRKLAYLAPGDPVMLGHLRAAAQQDADLVYARAVRHVLDVAEGAREPTAPPLIDDQPEQPDAVRALLQQGAQGPAIDVLRALWLHAGHLFRRDAGSYGVTGMERIAPTAPNPLARAYAAGARLLGVGRPGIFYRPQDGPLEYQVALIQPPALVLGGKLPSGVGHLAYHVGAMLTATLPEHALLYAMREEQLSEWLMATLVAFGPPDPERRVADVAVMAERLWESIPAREQRRLAVACEQPESLTTLAAWSIASQVARRAGLFLSGDLRVTVERACVEEGLDAGTLASSGGLARLCRDSQVIADLVRFAAGPEYADARWQPTRPKRGSTPSFPAMSF